MAVVSMRVTEHRGANDDKNAGGGDEHDDDADGDGCGEDDDAGGG